MRAEVHIHGLKEFKRNLKVIDRDLPKALRLALNEAAQTTVVATKAGVPKRTGRAAGSVRAASTQSAARVRAGGGRAPYYPWLDFGGAVGRRNATRRPFISDGRYLYPAYRRHRPQFQRELSKALTDLIRRSGIEVT